MGGGGVSGDDFLFIALRGFTVMRVSIFLHY